MNELYKRLYKNGAGCVLSYILDPRKYYYVSIVGDIENIRFDQYVHSTKYNQIGLREHCQNLGHVNIEDYFHKYFDRLGIKKHLTSGNCGYTITDDDIYFIGQFDEQTT